MKGSQLLCVTSGWGTDTNELATLQNLLLFYTALLYWCGHRDLYSPLQRRIYHPSGKLIAHKSSPWVRLHWPEGGLGWVSDHVCCNTLGRKCVSGRDFPSNDSLLCHPDPDVYIHSPVILSLSAMTSPQIPEDLKKSLAPVLSQR